MITPCACARDNIIGFVCRYLLLAQKLPDLGIWQGPRTLQILNSVCWPCLRTLLTMCSLLMRTINLAQYGRQQAARIIEFSDHRYQRCSARGMCSIELYSYSIVWA